MGGPRSADRRRRDAARAGQRDKPESEEDAAADLQQAVAKVRVPSRADYARKRCGRWQVERLADKKKGSTASLKLTEEEIDEILERFISRYLNAVEPHRDNALRLVLDGLRKFLREHDLEDFASGEEFADRLLDVLESDYELGWSSVRARQAINTEVRDIYEWYRLSDTTPFGDGSFPRLQLGGPDRVSIDFIGRLDHFYFSKFADNTRAPMRRFFVERYFEDGAALFGRESSEELADFREASGERFKNLTDRQTLTIVQTAVQRTRNWAHIGSMAQAEIELAKIVATLDARTTALCEFLDGKLVRVGVAQEAIERLAELPPEEFALQLYLSDVGKQLAKNPVETISRYIEADGKTIGDELTRMGRGFPPFHPNCRTRMEGVIEGLDDD